MFFDPTCKLRYIKCSAALLTIFKTTDDVVKDEVQSSFNNVTESK